MAKNHAQDYPYVGKGRPEGPRVPGFLKRHKKGLIVGLGAAGLTAIGAGIAKSVLTGTPMEIEIPENLPEIPEV